MTRKISIILLLVAALMIFLSGCDNSGDSKYVEQVVLNGYMYIGGPLSVNLTHTIPIEQYYDPAEMTVSGATVTVWANDRPYSLLEDSQHPGTYSLPVDSHRVTTGESYRIRVTSGSHVLTALTDSAADTIRIDSMLMATDTSIFHPAHWRDANRMDTLTFFSSIDWLCKFFYRPSPRTEGYALFIENLEPDWASKDRKLSTNVGGGDQFNLFFWTQRFGDYFEVPPVTVGATGRFRLRLFSCDRPVYKYFSTNNPGDPHAHVETNVSGGLGVFGTVDCDTAYFYLKDNPSIKH